MSNLTVAEQKRFDSRWTARKGGCHTWRGGVDRDGYGLFFFRRKTRRAARVAWFAAHGQIQKGYVVNHLCRNRACVNVRHLNVLTAAENSLQDSAGAGYLNTRKVACPKGHPYDKVVVWGGKKQRICTICERARQKRLRAKWRAEDTLMV